MDTQLIQIDLARPDRSTLRAVARRLERGEICVLPTDTIYGFHCRADHPVTLARLQALKERGEPKPMVVLISGPDHLAAAGIAIPPAARRLMERFWPGPLTLVLPAPGVFHEALTGGETSVAVRQPGFPVLARLIEMAGGPLASTSVNVTGAAPLNEPAAIAAAFDGRVECVVDGGLLPESTPSTIVSFVVNPPTILREGTLPAAFIRSVLAES
ncbi:MAG TPA: L-threonylcarbamoyladenylate synthase [Acidobacteriota bacterium]|nr:L-threonylcarbamoyladenylate synthase [Acidobacteriota bacterium]HQF87366.1 L-threonylcarbamoyladenylate synthase [Acidobacteriota bacterium]HQG91940.1 L-threonylcarbamoyladenylate synthase [Acidobacteriota bacterium]HQK87320.1 L-threonylcarbamoyladenylate synthase [Acidobacteriota bacterium]